MCHSNAQEPREMEFQHRRNSTGTRGFWTPTILIDSLHRVIIRNSHLMSTYSVLKGKPTEVDPPERPISEKRYDPVPQVTSTSQYNPSSAVLVNHTAHPKHTQSEVSSVSVEVPNPPLPKPEPPPPQTKPTLFRPANREDTVQSNFFPQKSFPDKSPVNGTEQPLKTITPSYNRFTPKPYTSSARPFERKFESPKFNHNLLPNEAQAKPELPAKPHNSPQPILKSTNVTMSPELDGTSKQMDSKSKYQPNNVNSVPKAIPVSPSALEEDDDDDSHTVVATARGIFNSNGGVLSSIETGVSIIIPQGAIPDGIEQEIYFKVCRDNSILPPLDKEKGETLLSPLVMCGPHGLKFLKPVELRLPHCASMTPDGWSFALKSSDTSSDNNPNDCEYESDDSYVQDSSSQETLDSLIEAVNQTLKVAEESVSTPEHVVSFKKTKRVQKIFVNHLEFKEIVQKHRDRPDKRFMGQKPIEAKYPFPQEPIKDWLQSPSVVPAVSHLASKTILSLSDGSSVKNPSDRQIDYLACSIFEATGASLFPSFAASWVAKAMVAWTETLSTTIQVSDLPPEAINLANLIAQAGDFVVNASIDAANCAAQAAANAISIRRALWLRNWRPDSASKLSDISALPGWSFILEKN
ncbi:unnamed protein product [Ranitomeya imitator]|uniref:Netrin receptor UNC5 n=1 Tax=Ranitomeya imitator TaxID=111125 RepID=A0ABN9LB76_9NEOB|nr:unnamed protein product [Ranitomeya imitator]